MSWVEYHIEISAEHSQWLSDELTELGAQALTYYDAGDQPIYEPAFDKAPPIWSEAVLVALFDRDDDTAPILHFLHTQQELGHLKKFSTKDIADENWERRCLDGFKPISFGKRLWICPSWETPPEPDAINIILDPGLAFGTGTHPTTSLCLEWLDENFKAGQSVIDYGCGSGILALAACKLGASEVFAVDHDPQALIATTDNAERNQISSEQLKTFLPDQFAAKSVDLVLANILAGPLLELAPSFANFLRPSGICVLSGILAEQIDQIKNCYSTYFDLEVPVFKQDWVRIVGVRK